MYIFISISRYGNFLGFPKLEPVRIPRGSPFPLRGGSLRPKASRGFRKRPEGSQKLPMSSPVPAPVAPEAPQKDARDCQGCPEAPKRLPRLPRGFPRHPEASQNPLLSRQRLPEDARRCSRCSRKEPRHSQKAPRCLLGWRPCLWKIWPGAREEKIRVFFCFKSRPRRSASQRLPNAKNWR